MQKIRISNLVAGITIDHALFSEAGQKLIPAGTRLTQRHIDALERSGALQVIAADTVEALYEAGILSRADRSSLAVGQRASQRVLSTTGQVVVEEGDEVEAHHLQALDAGGEAFTSSTQSRERREQIALADAMAEELEQQLSKLPMRVQAHVTCDWLGPANPADWPEPSELVAWRASQVSKVSTLYARLEAGIPVDRAELDDITGALLEKLVMYPTRFPQLALLCPRQENYLPDHCFTVAVLAMAMAAQLKWSEDDARLVGLMGLLFDLGMLMVPERIRTGACELTDIDRSRVQRHPIFSLAMMQHISDLHPMVRVTAYMHHERESGGGYPSGRRRDSISDYARVIAVADTYAATTEPRHYRKEKLPYIAMEETLHSTAALAFWKPAVRALIQAAGLFPVGSYVRLSSGDNAHVLASNPQQLDRPTVQPLDRDGQPKGPTIDLATIHKATLTIARPVMGPGE